MRALLPAPMVPEAFPLILIVVLMQLHSSTAALVVPLMMALTVVLRVRSHSRA